MTIAASGLPTESYDLLGTVKGDATHEASTRYMKAYGVPLIGGPQLHITAKEVDAHKAREDEAVDLAAFARGLFAPLGGVELELPPREPAREPPSFGAGENELTGPNSPGPEAAGGGTRRR